MKLKFQECQHSSHGIHVLCMFVDATEQMMILYTHPGKKNADSKTLVFHNSPPTTEKRVKKMQCMTQITSCANKGVFPTTTANKQLSKQTMKI